MPNVPLTQQDIDLANQALQEAGSSAQLGPEDLLDPGVAALVSRGYLDWLVRAEDGEFRAGLPVDANYASMDARNAARLAMGLAPEDRPPTGTGTETLLASIDQVRAVQAELEPYLRGLIYAQPAEVDPEPILLGSGLSSLTLVEEAINSLANLGSVVGLTSDVLRVPALTGAFNPEDVLPPSDLGLQDITPGLLDLHQRLAGIRAWLREIDILTPDSINAALVPQPPVPVVETIDEIQLDGTVQPSVRVSWSALPTDKAVVTRWRDKSSLTWRTQQTPGGATETRLLAVRQNKNYIVQVAQKTEKGQSAWSAPQEVTVQGGINSARIVGLELAGQGIDTRFSGKDVRLAWRGAFPDMVGRVDAESAQPGVAPFDSPYIRGYCVRVSDPETGRLLSTSQPQLATEFVYSYEDNLRDGGPCRRLRFAVSIVPKIGPEMGTATLTVSNPAPSLPADLVVQGVTLGIRIAYTPTADNDWRGIVVYASETQPVPIDAAHLVYRGLDTDVTITSPAGARRWLRIAQVDAFGEGLAEFTDEIEVTAQSINTADLAQHIIGSDQLTPFLSSRIDLVDAPSTVPGSVAARIQSETTARTQAHGALAETVSTLSSTVDGNVSAVQTQASAIDGLSARYTVKVDVNGRVAGFGVASETNTEGVTSHFAVVADKFSITLPDEDEDRYLFAAGTDPTNGQPTVVIDGAFYAGNIAANQIKAGELDAGVIYGGTISATNLTSGNITGKQLFMGNGQAGVHIDGEACNILVTAADNTKRVAIGRFDPGSGVQHGLWVWNKDQVAILEASDLAGGAVKTRNIVAENVTFVRSVTAAPGEKARLQVTIANLEPGDKATILLMVYANGNGGGVNTLLQVRGGPGGVLGPESLPWKPDPNVAPATSPNYIGFISDAQGVFIKKFEVTGNGMHEFVSWCSDGYRKQEEPIKSNLQAYYADIAAVSLTALPMDVTIIAIVSMR